MGKHGPSAWRVLLGGSSRYWAGCHTKTRWKHTSRLCAVFGLVLFELGTDMTDLEQMSCEEYDPCQLFQQTRTVHSEV